MRKVENGFGSQIFTAIVRPTFYKQFVGGDKESELMATASLLKKSNLRLMVCPGKPLFELKYLHLWGAATL